MKPTKAAAAGYWAARTAPVGGSAPVGPPSFVFNTASTGPVNVFARPHLSEFLHHCSRLGDVVLFTSSTEEYARAIVSHIDPGGGIFSRVLSRRRCHQIAPGFYAKNLDSIGAALARTVLVDDLPTSFSLYPDNGIPIQPYYGDTEDRALVDLLPFLQSLSEVRESYEYPYICRCIYTYIYGEPIYIYVQIYRATLDCLLSNDQPFWLKLSLIVSITETKKDSPNTYAYTCHRNTTCDPS